MVLTDIEVFNALLNYNILFRCSYKRTIKVVSPLVFYIVMLPIMMGNSSLYISLLIANITRPTTLTVS